MEANRNKYEGHYIEGKEHGLSKITYADGDIEISDFDSNLDKYSDIMVCKDSMSNGETRACYGIFDDEGYF